MITRTSIVTKQLDAYKIPLAIGDYIIKSAKNSPRYAIILDMIRVDQGSYAYDNIRIISDDSKNYGDTWHDRVMKVEQSQIPLATAINLSKKLESYWQKNGTRT